MSGNLEFMSGSQNKSESKTSGILKFTGLSALVGVLGVLLLAPIGLVGGSAATTGLNLFENLPTYLKPVTGSQASTLYANDGDEKVVVANFYHENRISISYNDMSTNIRNAVVATEDPRFFEHGGVDWLSLARATATNAISAGNGPGGSTITMQYVKNSLVEAANLAGDKEAIAAATTASGIEGIARKFKEIRMAIALEGVSSKQDILAGYLNLSFFGNQINGIEAASNYYFGVKASELNIPQAALLAGMLKSPNDYKPDEEGNLERAKGRRDYVIDNMAAEGYITGAEADAAKATPIEVNLTHTPSGCEANQTTAFFCDFTVWTIRNNVEFGATPEDRENLLRRGGLQIYSTLDLDAQTAAHEATMTWAPYDDPSQIGSATVSVQAGTGRILAMAENRVFDQTQSDELGHTSVNYATDREYGGSSGFQTGSTYKVFTLAQWLTAGFQLNDHVDGRVKEWGPGDFSARCGGVGGTWKPNNIVKEPEDLTVVQATTMSVNTAYVDMASQLDLCDIRDTAARFGVHRADGAELSYVPSSVIGVNEIAPLTMAAAMAGIANKGVYCSPVAIDRIVIRETQAELKVPTSDCSAAVTPEVAAGMTYAMQRVISGGTGGASSTGDGTPLAGKTGTTDSGVHTWMTGFSSAVGTATWVGNVVGNKSLGAYRLNNKAANTVRHDIWRTTMKAINKLYPGSAFDAPPASMVAATMITVPATGGQDPAAAEELINASDLNAKIQTRTIVSNQPEGTVARTVPGAGRSVPRGSQILIYISKGGTLKVPDVAGMSVVDAKSTLLAAGFAAVSEPQPSQTQFFVPSETIPAGFVVGTSPAAGTSATATGAILLILSTGP
jgi:membrane peptidoglycan carboxypeptidase